jgi:AcrR family transcriptional regulator
MGTQTAEQDVSKAEEAPLPPRMRILAVASELFYERGVRAVGVEEIAAAAGTNKMTLYRHFPSKDELVAECLRQKAKRASTTWDEVAAAHPGDPMGELKGWLARMAEIIVAKTGRGCPFSNAAVELPEKDHPARRVIEEHKQGQRERMAELCRAAGLTEPESVADDLVLLLEGALVAAQSMGHQGPACNFVRSAERVIAAHRGTNSNM